MAYNAFADLGQSFSERADGILRQSTIRLVNKHMKEGAAVYVVSASIEEWVRPMCSKFGVADVLGTRIDVDDQGLLTGRFLTANCYGQEKVRRLLEIEPQRNEYYLYAYGDSRGDREMLGFADKGTMVK